MPRSGSRREYAHAGRCSNDYLAEYEPWTLGEDIEQSAVASALVRVRRRSIVVSGHLWWWPSFASPSMLPPRYRTRRNPACRKEGRRRGGRAAACCVLNKNETGTGFLDVGDLSLILYYLGFHSGHRRMFRNSKRTGWRRGDPETSRRKSSGAFRRSGSNFGEGSAGAGRFVSKQRVPCPPLACIRSAASSQWPVIQISAQRGRPAPRSRRKFDGLVHFEGLYSGVSARRFGYLGFDTARQPSPVSLCFPGRGHGVL